MRPPKMSAGHSGVTDGEIIDAGLARDLSELIDALESVEWHRVPGISSPTAAVFTRMVTEARQDVRRGT